MEEIEGMSAKYICKYCLGCNEEELDSFEPKYNCKNFIPGYEKWTELRRKELKKSEQVQK